MTNPDRRKFLQLTALMVGTGPLVACGGGSDGDDAAIESLTDDDRAMALRAAPVQQLLDAPAVTIGATGLMQFTLTGSASRQSSRSMVRLAAPFSLGYAFKRGDVPAGCTVESDAGSLQVTPRSHWPDGSLKFAQLAGRAVLPSSNALVVTLSKSSTAPTSTPLTLAHLRNTAMTAQISCGTFGNATWSGADWDTPFQSWVAGSEMSSWVYRKPVGSDAHLVAWLEVRLFASGAVEVLPWIENGYLKVTNPTNKNATYAFTLGGTLRFSAVINLKHHQRTPLVSGNLLSHWLGADPGVVPLHDAIYLQATELVPTYAGVVAANAAVVSALPATFTPLQAGSFAYSSDDMSSPGYQAPIGLLPQHDVLHLVVDPAARQATYAAVIRNGYSAGRYALHQRDELTNRPPAFSAHPTLVLAGGAIKDAGASTTNTLTPATTGGAPPLWDTAHAPSVGFMAYLLTGRFYFMEEVQFCATTIHFSVTDWARGGGDPGNGYMPAPGYTGASGIVTGFVQLRAGAWWMRSLAQALCVTPTTDPLHAEFKASVQNTINWHHARYVAQPNNPFGFVRPDVDYNTSGVFMSSPWMQDFYTAAFGYAKAMGLPLEAAPTANLTAFFAWTAQSVVGRLGTSTGTDWWYVNGAPYTIAVAPSDTPNWANGTGPWYPSWRAMYNATYATLPPELGSSEGVLAGQYFPEETNPGQWNNLQPALAYAVRFGVAGAQAAYSRMTGASNFAALATVWNSKPGWGIRPPLGVLPETGLHPSYLNSKSVNEWFEIPGTKLTPDGSQNGRLSYSGIATDAGTQIILAASGGHGDSAHNGVDSIDLAADAPAWVQRRPSSWNGIETDKATYASGEPASRHTYEHSIFSTTRQRLILHSTRATYSSAQSFAVTRGLNTSNWTWDPLSTYNTQQISARCRDADDNCWGFAGYYQLWKWTAATDSWAKTGTFAGQVTAPMAADSSRSLIFQLSWGDGQGGGSGVLAYKYTNGGTVQTAITLNSVSGALAQFISDAPILTTMVYDAARDRFLFWAGEARRLYQILPNAGNTWDISIVATTGALPPRSEGGFSRMAYIPSLQSLFVMPQGSLNLYAMKIA